LWVMVAVAFSAAVLLLPEQKKPEASVTPGSSVLPDTLALAKSNLDVLPADLAKGQRLTLIEAVGPPKAYRWVAHGPHDTLNDDPTKPFSLHADNFALLELVPPHELERYRLRVELHHESGAATGGVGVYIGHSTQFTAKRQAINCFFGVDFNDIAPFPGRNPAEGNILRPRLHLLASQSPEQVQGWVKRASVGISTTFQPVGNPTTKKWRTIQFDVAPEEVRLKWDGESVGSLTQANKPAHVRALFAMLREPLQEAPRFLPQEAIGIYLHDASAWVRSCTIEPLPKPHPN
jgi:hypothetical protein